MRPDIQLLSINICIYISYLHTIYYIYVYIPTLHDTHYYIIIYDNTVTLLTLYTILTGTIYIDNYCYLYNDDRQQIIEWYCNDINITSYEVTGFRGYMPDYTGTTYIVYILSISYTLYMYNVRIYI